MNKIILWMQSSFDGNTQGPNGEFDWPVVGEELTRYFVEELQHAGMFLYGRKVYEGMAAYWPTADADPNSDPNHVAYATLWKPMPKVVFSRSLPSAGWNTTVLAEVEQIRGPRDSAQGDLYFFGGSETAARLIQLDLIDEYQVFVHPVVLGGGSSLFPTVGERQGLALVETRPFGDVVSLRYARSR